MSSTISRSLGRIKQQLHLITLGHVLNPFWDGRLNRRRRRYQATRSAAMGYLRRYAPEVSKLKPEPMAGGNEPERAFTIWFQGEDNAPELVKACFRSMRRHLKQDLVVLDENTLFDWITLPDFIVRKWKEGKIPHTQFSDICRIELLYEHGGVWLDATDYVTAPIPQYIMDEDFFLFMAGSKIRGSYALIQSCFIRGKKGNELLSIWRAANNIYWKDENSKINYFIHHLLLNLAVDNNADAAELFARMPKVDQDPTHALWGDHATDTYSPQLFDELTRDSFFQKTNYKDSRLASAAPDSIAQFILKS
ncbi:MAG: capsular polysaccharide synthesis protein [Muribaculaceae bacterium]|nr:capsular polysaccharide synthesis protein [Muribaculaceae bacterium]